MTDTHEPAARSEVDKALQQTLADLGLTAGVPQGELKRVSLRIVSRLMRQRRVAGEPLWIAGNRLDPEDLKEWGQSKWHKEILVDLHVLSGLDHPYRTVLTVESEGSRAAARALERASPDAMLPRSDLLWDCFKLLMVPSPHRLFVTRSNKPDKLHASFGRYLARYTCEPVTVASLPRTDVFDLIVVPPKPSPSGAQVYRWTRSPHGWEP
jgi:hypothetical protein